MLQFFILIIVLVMPVKLSAQGVDELKKIIALQQAEIMETRNKVATLSQKLNKYVGDDGTWKGNSTGLIGPQGPQGPQGNPGSNGGTGAQGPTGPAGPGTLLNISTSELNNCATICGARQMTCLVMTSFNWDTASNDKCFSIIGGAKRCLCIAP